VRGWKYRREKIWGGNAIEKETPQGMGTGIAQRFLSCGRTQGSFLLHFPEDFPVLPPENQRIPHPLANNGPCWFSRHRPSSR